MANFLVAIPGARFEGIVGGKMGERFSGTHFEELADGTAEVGGGENVRLKAVSFAGGTSDKNVRKKLHGDFFIAHPPAAFTATPPGIKRKGGSGQASALGLFRRGIELAHEIVNVEVEEGGRAGSLGERGLIDEKNIRDGLLAGEGLHAGRIFNGAAEVVKEGFVNDFVHEGAFT